MKKNKISKDWINKRRKDIYVRQSKIEGYKSRAIYKIKEIDEILDIFATAIDNVRGLFDDPKSAEALRKHLDSMEK